MVLCCLRKKSKSLPSQYSRTVQKLESKSRLDEFNCENPEFRHSRIGVDFEYVEKLHYARMIERLVDVVFSKRVSLREKIKSL